MLIQEDTIYEINNFRLPLIKYKIFFRRWNASSRHFLYDNIVFQLKIVQYEISIYVCFGLSVFVRSLNPIILFQPDNDIKGQQILYHWPPRFLDDAAFLQRNIVTFSSLKGYDITNCIFLKYSWHFFFTFNSNPGRKTS